MITYIFSIEKNVKTFFSKEREREKARFKSVYRSITRNFNKALSRIIIGAILAH